MPAVAVEIGEDAPVLVAHRPDIDRVHGPTTVGAEQLEVEQGTAELLPPPEALQGAPVPGVHALGRPTPSQLPEHGLTSPAREQPWSTCHLPRYGLGRAATRLPPARRGSRSGRGARLPGARGDG